MITEAIDYKSKLNGQCEEIQKLRETAGQKCLDTAFNPCSICEFANFILRNRLGMSLEKEGLLIQAVEEICCPEEKKPEITKRRLLMIKG